MVNTMNTSRLSVTAFSLALCGCSAALVPFSSNPYQVLANADALLSQGRPTPAERLINDALALCQQRNEPLCLAESYRVYASFFMSNALIGQWKSHYQQQGFLDPAATYDSRYERALYYLENALPPYRAAKKYDALTNLKLNTGLAYFHLGDLKKACAAFDESVLANQQNLRVNPSARVVLPQGFASYESYINRVKTEVGCLAAG